MSRESEALRKRVQALERELATLKQQGVGRGIRKRSTATLWGLPLYAIAVGPDAANSEIRGHARGIVAIGDIATGVFAVAGLARGVIAIGGLAVGVVALGGCAVGLGAALGGLAIGTLAFGGGAIGAIAVGGGAFGYYACGGSAAGQYVLSAMQQDPEALRFFSRWFPPLAEWYTTLRR